jgi:hypothetical protein
VLPAAGYCDHSEWVEQLPVKHIQAGFRIAAAHGRHRFRPAEQMQAHVDVVDQKVEHAAAALLRVLEPSAPCGAAQRRRKKAPRTAPSPGRAWRSATYSGKKRSTCAVMRILPARFAGDHAARGGALQRHGLFHQNVLAGAQRFHRRVFVQEGGQAEIHGIDFGIVQQRPRSRYCLTAEKSKRSPAVPDCLVWPSGRR